MSYPGKPKYLSWRNTYSYQIKWKYWSPMDLIFRSFLVLGYSSGYRDCSPAEVLGFASGCDEIVRGQGVVSLVFRELSKMILQKYTLEISHLHWEFRVETLYVCPKHGFGHTYSVWAWNSHNKYDSAIRKFRENVLESVGNISETGDLVTWLSLSKFLVTRVARFVPFSHILDKNLQQNIH